MFISYEENMNEISRIMYINNILVHVDYNVLKDKVFFNFLCLHNYFYNFITTLEQFLRKRQGEKSLPIHNLSPQSWKFIALKNIKKNSLKQLFNPMGFIPNDSGLGINLSE